MNMLKRLSFLIIPAILAVAAGCSGRSAGSSSLSSDEIALIMGSDSLMRVLSVFDHGDSLVLRKVSVDFTDEDLRSEAFRTLTAKLLYTVSVPSQDGVGIAAPQVGLSRRVVAVQRYDIPGEPFGVYPNARLDSLWGEKVPGPEGCLSIPGMRGSVPRFPSVIVSYKDPVTLKTVRDTVEGFTAVIFQHEIDHLDGVLYIDRADTLWVDDQPY